MTAPSDPPVQPRASTLKAQRLANRVVRSLLATPLISKGIGRRLVTLYLVGRRSGRRLTVPVAYTLHDGVLLIGTPFAWGRNLSTGQQITVRYKGRRRLADVTAFTGEQDVVARYAIMASDNPRFASFNKVSFDERGAPQAADLQLAWAAGARAFELRLH